MERNMPSDLRKQPTSESSGVSPYATSPGRSRNMAAIRRSDTKPELAVRSALHRRGHRFRKDLRLDLGATRPRPDIVFTRRKVAVFIDGCFWHACPDHSSPPATTAATGGRSFRATLTATGATTRPSKRRAGGLSEHGNTSQSLRSWRRSSKL